MLWVGLKVRFPATLPIPLFLSSTFYVLNCFDDSRWKRTFVDLPRPPRQLEADQFKRLVESNSPENMLSVSCYIRDFCLRHFQPIDRPEKGTPENRPVSRRLQGPNLQVPDDSTDRRQLEQHGSSWRFRPRSRKEEIRDRDFGYRTALFAQFAV